MTNVSSPDFNLTSFSSVRQGISQGVFRPSTEQLSGLNAGIKGWMFFFIHAFVMQCTPQDQNPILTFEGKRYDINALPDEVKELVRGMQVAEAQLRMYEDTLKVLAIGRQSMAFQLNERLKDVTPLPG